MSDLLTRLQNAPLPLVLHEHAEIKAARQLVRRGLIEAKFAPPSMGRGTFGQERCAVILRCWYSPAAGSTFLATEPGWALGGVGERRGGK